MSQIPVTARALRSSALALWSNAEALGSCNGSLLLRFYSVECEMKSRFLSHQLANPHGDTSAIPVRTFGASGHDLDMGRKALKAPAVVPAAPVLTLTVTGSSVPIRDAHQVWRYGIKHLGAAAVETWLKQVAAWLEESR